jgi:hypothetical protein
LIKLHHSGDEETEADEETAGKPRCGSGGCVRC